MLGNVQFMKKKFNLQENDTDSGTAFENVTLDCGVWDQDVEASVETCCFWMEGIMLIGTGMFVGMWDARAILE